MSPIYRSCFAIIIVLSGEIGFLLLANSVMGREKLPAEVAEPEFVVGILEVGALVAVIAVHSVRIDHKVEFLAGFMHCIQKLQGVLVVDIVVSSAVGEFQHNWFYRARDQSA